MSIKTGAIILNYNDSGTTIKAVKLFDSIELIERIVVVDNCSTDGSYQELITYKSDKVTIIKSDRNGGYGYGNNYGIKYMNSLYKPQYIIISNPDIEVEEHVVSNMIDVFDADERIAVVAPFMVNRDGYKDPGTAWHIPSKYEYIFSAEFICGHFLKPSYYRGLDKMTDRDFMEVDCVAGSFLMVDSSLMSRYGMYDENIFLFGEETSLGCKLKTAGLKTILLLNDTFLHLHGVSINKTIGSELKKRRMLLNSREYILKTYLGANRLDLVLAKIVYGMAMIEYRILLVIKRLFRL